MNTKEIYDKYPQVLGVISFSEGKLILNSDDTRIDEDSLVIFLNEVISHYLQSKVN